MYGSCQPPRALHVLTGGSNSLCCVLTLFSSAPRMSAAYWNTRHALVTDSAFRGIVMNSLHQYAYLLHAIDISFPLPNVQDEHTRCTRCVARTPDTADRVPSHIAPPVPRLLATHIAVVDGASSVAVECRSTLKEQLDRWGSAQRYGEYWVVFRSYDSCSLALCEFRCL